MSGFETQGRASVVAEADESAAFEGWYVRSVFNLEAAPIGSRDCLLQREAWMARAALAAAPASPAAVEAVVPIDMVLHGPACGLQHVDAADTRPGKATRSFPDGRPDEVFDCTYLGAWINPPHRSHLCHGCGHIWRPADVPTNGVAAVKTAGKADSPLAAPTPAPATAQQPAEGERAAPFYSVVGYMVGFDDVIHQEPSPGARELFVRDGGIDRSATGSAA